MPRRLLAVLLATATAIVALLVVSLVGCDEPAPPPGPRVSPTSVTGIGVVRGRVSFDGPTPTRAVVRNSPCCPDAPATLLKENVVVNPNGTLRNVVVSLEGGPMVDGTSLPPVLLDQKFCQYVPHVVGVVVNQTLKVRSSDPTYHNVRIEGDVYGTRNRGMSGAGATETYHFDRPERLTSACDVHSWMTAHILVMDNPLFAVTGDDGTFEITGVPPGHYTLVTWHEQYARQETPIDVKAGVVTADFSYHP